MKECCKEAFGDGNVPVEKPKKFFSSLFAIVRSLLGKKKMHPASKAGA